MKKIIYIFLFMFLTVNSSNASMTGADMTSTTVLKNLRYSDETIRLIQLKATNLFAEPIEPENEKNYIKFYKYLNPGTDGLEFGIRDIKFYSNWRDTY